MARRVFLHVGPPKTGTSFLQAAWFQHRHELAEQGLLYPGRHRLSQFRASAVALHKSPVVERMPAQQRRAWDRLTSTIEAWEGDALLSSEHYSLGSAERAAAIMARLGQVADEVHLVVTARDLARQVPAAWQQQVKQGLAASFDDFWRGLAADPGRGFWMAQDLPSLLDRWAADIPAGHAHLVVHGRPGSPKDLLWTRTCRVLGVDPAILQSVTSANESLGVVHTELLRRVNADLPPDRDRLAMGRLTKSVMARQVLVPTGTHVRMGLPDDAQAWLVERSRTMVDQLHQGGWDVVGDLDDLLAQPSGGSGRTPDSVTDTELRELATAAFAQMLVRELDARKERQDLTRQNRQLRRRLASAPRRRQQVPGPPAALPGRARRVVRGVRRRARRVAAPLVPGRVRRTRRARSARA